MGQFVYLTSLITFGIGLLIILISDNYLKKIIGLGVFQNSVLIFYIAIGKISGGRIPIYSSSEQILKNHYSAPLNHILMLTAIVVGFATLSVGLALMREIYLRHSSLSEQEILVKTINDENNV